MNIYAIEICKISYNELLGCYNKIEDSSVLEKVFRTEEQAEEYGKQVLDSRASKIPDAVANGKHIYMFTEDGIKKMLRSEVIKHTLEE